MPLVRRSITQGRFIAIPFAILIALVSLLALGCGGAAGGEAKSAGAPPVGEAMQMAAGGKEEEGKDQTKKDATTWRRSSLGAHTVHVKIGDRDELPVRSMQANVSIQGFMARVVLDVVVVNDRGGTYEGTFQLRLPEGASPYFFAFGQSVLQVAGDAAPPLLAPDRVQKMGADPAAIMSSRVDLWRGPKEARMVPRELAARAYRDTVHRAVDPALLEWSGPGIFNGRVFPLTAGPHRIVVGYDVPLTRIGDDLEYVFDLPAKVRSKTLDVNVATTRSATIEVTPKPPSSNSPAWLSFVDPPGDAVTVRIKKPGATYLVSGSYVAADVAPAIPSAGASRASDTALLLIDTSLSSNPDRFNVWLALAEAVLKNNRDTIKRFNALFFNVEQSFFKQGFVPNDDASVAELLAHARGLALEGATDISAALRRAMNVPGADASARWDLFLLSDGASTWGEPDAFVSARGLVQSRAGALFAYKTGLAGTDEAALSLLARETGGALFSVTGDAEVKAASTAHKRRPMRLVVASIDGVSDVIVAGRPRFVYPGQVLRVAGRGRPAIGASLALTLESDGQTTTVRTPLGSEVPSALASRAYGLAAVAQIEELLPVTDAVAPAYARLFRVTGKTCSLLMLEREEDYQRFGIRPEVDAAVVAQHPASTVVAWALAEMAGTLGDPKLAFVRWIRDLPKQSGISFAFPPSFKAALDRMPEASFRVEAPPLAVKRLDRAVIPQPLVASLAAHELDYDAMAAEADRRLRAFGPGDGLKALSSLVEQNPGDAVLARDVGMSVMTWGLPADAYHLFRRVASARPHEPPTYRAMAQSLARSGKIDLAIASFEVGLAGRWDARFGDFRRILAVEYAELLRRVVNGELKSSVPDFASERLDAVNKEIQLGKADIVVMITWNTDATDVDLHVIEPSGEECYYSHRETESGGRITQDVTQGYGPEMYVLPHAPPGKYLVRAKYYASDRNRASTRTKVHVVIFEDYGTSKQRMRESIVTLEYGKEMHDVATLVRGAAAQVAAP